LIYAIIKTGTGDMLFLTPPMLKVVYCSELWYEYFNFIHINKTTDATKKAWKIQ